MRLIKMLGLAAVAAVTAMALVGASSASATITAQSCMTKGGECKTASNNTTFTATGTEVKLKAAITNTCNNSTVAGTITDNSSSGAADPLTASLTSASFTNCNFATTSEQLPWALTT